MNRLPLSAKGMNPETADDYGCDYPGCEKRATGYLFMRQQFCDDHRKHYVGSLGEGAGPDNQEACQPNLVVAPRLPEGMPASSPSALAEGATDRGSPSGTSAGEGREPSAAPSASALGEAGDKSPASVAAVISPASPSASVVPLPQSEHQPPLGGRARLSPELAARAWVQVANAYRAAHGLGPL